VSARAISGGAGRQSSTAASIRDEPSVYQIGLDVSDFGEDDLTVEQLGRAIRVRADRQEGEAFGYGRHLDDTFRLPDDADADHAEAFYETGRLEIRVRRKPLTRRVVPVMRRHLVNPTPKGC
jgi:HSP20 family molecular chaperone IbpA